jgi:hypothetical protein
MTVDDETTLEQPAVHWGGVSTDGAERSAPTPAEAWAPDGIAADDEQWNWPSRAAKPGVRLRVPTLALVALLFAAGGLWGGAALQRSHGTPAASSSAASSFASLFGRRGTGGTATGTGAGGAATTAAAAAGTVTAVEGDVVYLTTTTGSIEKVVVSGTTTVTRNAKSSASNLQPGDTVVVQGTKETNGSVDASSIAATQTGVTSGFAGLGG